MVPVIVPIVLAGGGVGGGGYLLFAKIVQFPVAGAVAVVAAVGGVLLASMQKVGVVCEKCGATAAMTPEEERKLSADEKNADVEKLRDQLAAKLRPQIEDDLRPQLENELRPTIERELRSQLEDELRPQLAEELRAQFEEELRPNLEERLRPEIERQLRGEIERQVKAQMAAQARVAQPVGQQPQARAAGATPAPTNRPQPAPPMPSSGRNPSGSWSAGDSQPRMQAAPAAHVQPQTSGPIGGVGAVTDPHARAQRRARVIVSDIALYHKDLIAQAVRAPDPKKVLDSIWEEAVRSYNESVSEDVRRSTNYLVDAFEAFIAQRRKEANL
jgi:hypothetical protein